MSDQLGPDPNEIGYDSAIVEDEGSGGSSSTTASQATTLCDLDIENNVWVEGVVDLAANKRGICMLDTMSKAQIIDVLQHNPRARDDLKKVTSNAELLELVEKVPLHSVHSPSQSMQSGNVRAGLPFYNVFRGRPPNAQFTPKKKP